MRYKYFIPLLLVVFSWPAKTIAGTILVVGDSLSAAYGIQVKAGWVALLQQRLKEQGFPHQVVNASISGDTTANGLARLPQALGKYRPEVVIIQLGGNDGLRGLPLAQMQHNIAAMISKARTQGAKVLLVGVFLPPNYGRAYVEKFRAVYRGLAERLDVPLAPFILEGVATRTDLMQNDGIHPTARAQPIMLDNVWPYLAPLLSDHRLSDGRIGAFWGFSPVERIGAFFGAMNLLHRYRTYGTFLWNHPPPPPFKSPRLRRRAKTAPPANCVCRWVWLIPTLRAWTDSSNAAAR